MYIQKVCIYKHETVYVCINIKYMQNIKLNIRILTGVTLTFLKLYFKNCLHYTYITSATGRSICVPYFLWRSKRPRITNTNGRRENKVGN